MRMCYSIDVEPAGKLKLEGGSLRAIIRYNCRIPRLAVTDAQVGANSNAEARRRKERLAVPDAEMTKENIVPHYIGLDLLWFNPNYGHGKGIWVVPNDLSATLNAEPEKPAMDALYRLLGIKEVDGTLRYGEGRGDYRDRRPKPDANAKWKWRRKARKAVRHDAVSAVDVILQASPSFFFSKIREKEWTQEQIDKFLFHDRCELDQRGVHAFRRAGLAWAKDRWGEERIAKVALHLDESCPHMHTVLVHEQNGWLNATKGIAASPADARAMLDSMKPFLSGNHNGMRLERPPKGGRSTDATYVMFNRELGQDSRKAESGKAEAEREAEQDEADARRRSVFAGMPSSPPSKGKPMRRAIPRRLNRRFRARRIGARKFLKKVKV